MWKPIPFRHKEPSPPLCSGGGYTAKDVMLSESSALRGFRRRTPPMRSAHLPDGQNNLRVQVARGVNKKRADHATGSWRSARTRRPERGKSCSNNLEWSQPLRKLAIDIEAQPARRLLVVLQTLMVFAVRNLSVSFFDVGSNGGALREFCDFRRGNGRKNLREPRVC